MKNSNWHCKGCNHSNVKYCQGCATLRKEHHDVKTGEWIGKHEGSLTIGINVMRILIKYQKRIEEEL